MFWTFDINASLKALIWWAGTESNYTCVDARIMEVWKWEVVTISYLIYIG